MKANVLMKLRIFLLFIVVFNYSCTPSTPSAEDTIAKLGKAYELQPTEERAKEYLELATEYIRNNKNNSQKIIPVLQQASDIAIHAKKFPSATGYLMGLIKEDRSGDNKIRLIQLGNIMLGLKKSHASNVIFKGLQETYPNDADVTALSAKLEGEIASTDGYVNYLFDQVLVDPNEFGINRNNALKFVDASEAFALTLPDNSNAPNFIYKAAEVARSLRTMTKAMNLYDWLLQKYPSHDKSPTTMFIKGFLLEQEFKEEDEARKVYEAFLQKYPDHEMASSAEFLLGNMGKSDEEILKGIEEKRQSQSAQ